MNCEHILKVGQKGDTENLKFVRVKSQIDGKELQGPDHPSVHVLNQTRSVFGGKSSPCQQELLCIQGRVVFHSEKCPFEGRRNQ